MSDDLYTNAETSRLLKEAGLPQQGHSEEHWFECPETRVHRGGVLRCNARIDDHRDMGRAWRLDELVAHLGDKFGSLYRFTRTGAVDWWCDTPPARSRAGFREARGDSPVEAVAALVLALAKS